MVVKIQIKSRPLGFTIRDGGYGQSTVVDSITDGSLQALGLRRGATLSRIREKDVRTSSFQSVRILLKNIPLPFNLEFDVSSSKRQPEMLRKDEKDALTRMQERRLHMGKTVGESRSKKLSKMRVDHAKNALFGYRPKKSTKQTGGAETSVKGAKTAPPARDSFHKRAPNGGRPSVNEDVSKPKRDPRGRAAFVTQALLKREPKPERTVTFAEAGSSNPQSASKRQPFKIRASPDQVTNEIEAILARLEIDVEIQKKIVPALSQFVLDRESQIHRKLETLSLTRPQRQNTPSSFKNNKQRRDSRQVPKEETIVPSRKKVRSHSWSV